MQYSKISDDDAYLDMCCFDLHQVIEFTLKFIAKPKGSRCKADHNLLIQLSDIEWLGIEIPDKSFYLSNASIINTWETQTRCLDDFTAVMSLADKVIEKIPELIKFADSLAEEDDGMSSETRNMNVFDG